MAINVLRRQSALDDSGPSSAESSRRPSLADTPRKSSIAGLSLRLTRSKRTNSTGNLIDTAAAHRLGQAFFSLPDEIITHVICHLSTQDFLALRLASRSLHSILVANAAPITRALLKRRAPTDHDLNCIQQIYPQPKPCLDEKYLLQMIRRQTMIDRMLSIIASYVQMKIYMIPSCPRFEDFSPYKRKLERRFHAAAWIIYHFLESYRRMLVFEHPSHGTSRSHDCHQCVAYINDLIRTYPPSDIIPAYHFYDLLLQHLRQLSRAPSYVGIIERRLRGWTRRPPADPELAQVIIIGGIPLLSKLSVLKGTYNQRVEVIGSFIDKLSESNPTQIRVFVTSKKSSSPSAPPLKIMALPGFESIKEPLDPPFSKISDKTVSSLPSLERFIADDWVVRMYETVGPDDVLTSAFGFVQNILAGKDDGPDYLEPVKGFV